jgi:hypothetical protein
MIKKMTKKHKKERDQLKSHFELVAASKTKGAKSKTDDPKSKAIKSSIVTAVKRRFEQIVFVSTLEQQKTFCDMIMDDLQFETLTYTGAKEDQPSITDYRADFYETYKGVMLKALNDHRSYCQVSDKQPKTMTSLPYYFDLISKLPFDFP